MTNPSNEADWLDELIMQIRQPIHTAEGDQKAKQIITTKIAEERIDELKLAEGQWLLMSPDVSEFVHYCIDRIAELGAGLKGDKWIK